MTRQDYNLFCGLKNMQRREHEHLIIAHIVYMIFASQLTGLHIQAKLNI